MHRSKEFYEKYYNTLKGAKIIAVDGGAEFPAFTVETPEGFRFVCEISRDEEANGPGFLFGLPTPILPLEAKNDHGPIDSEKNVSITEDGAWVKAWIKVLDEEVDKVWG